MGESAFGEGSWIFGLIVLLGIFGGGFGGFGGGNAAMAGLATTAEVQNSINAAMAQQNAQNVLLSSANNNYETAQLISGQNMAMMQQNNSNLINAIQGFNQVSGNIANGFANVSAQIADLGYRMDRCCCDIKTTLLEDRLQDAQTKLNQQFTAISNAEQSQYILGQLGTYTPRAAVL